MASQSNGAPQTVWRRIEMACETVRHRLYVNGQETPFFIDAAIHRAHFSYGHRIALFGSGMGQEIRTVRGSYRIAAFLEGFRTIEAAKLNAERRALV